MKAMVIDHLTRLEKDATPLKLMDLPEPIPGEGEILVKINACGVCHTEIDEIEGRTPPPRLPVIPGHQVVGNVVQLGPGVSNFNVGERVGVAWIYSACGHCSFCLSGHENLCASFKATGRDANGGYSQLMVVPAAFSYPIPEIFSDVEAAPQLCAGAVGYRSLELSYLRNGQNVGFSGFGASAHLVLKLVRHKYPETRIFVFSRSSNERDFALELGATWAGDFDQKSPECLSAIIDTTPAWKPVVEALRNLEPGGRLVINAIRKEEIDKNYWQHLNYPEHLWMEKEIKSVANVTRKDVAEYLALAASIPIKPEVKEYSLQDANLALQEMKNRSIRGAKVLVM